MVQLIKSMMGAWEISSYQDETPRIFGEEGQQGGGEGGRRRGGGGWRDDRMQLKLPEQTRLFFTCNLNLVCFVFVLCCLLCGGWSSQVPQPLLLVDGWVYNTLKTWEFFFRPFQRFFFVTCHEERIRIGQVDVSARDWPCPHSVSFTKCRVTAILRAPQDCHLHLRIATSASAVSNWRCSQMQNGEI